MVLRDTCRRCRYSWLVKKTGIIEMQPDKIPLRIVVRACKARRLCHNFDEFKPKTWLSQIIKTLFFAGYVRKQFNKR